jgi:hypothetical protein
MILPVQMTFRNMDTSAAVAAQFFSEMFQRHENID